MKKYKRSSRRIWIIAIAAVFSVTGNKLFAQQVFAFPGAEGAGKYTSGGRGNSSVPTTVFEVTNLNDDNNPGSLRYALTQTASYRTIVFRISGTIHLLSKLNIRSNTTIAGQTAPGDGICLADYPVVISGDNVILRYIRCRMGDKNQNKGMVDGSGGDDALGNLGNKNIIIDHCTASWSDDECLTVYRGDSLTMQWNLISEPLNYSYHFETGDTDYEHHGYGGIWGSKHGSFHHNLLAHCKNRMPRFAGVSTYSPAVQGIEVSDLRNNVLYNWGINNIYGGEGGYYNVVNNYLKPGPSTTSRKTQIVSVDSSTAYPYAKYFLAGNFITSSATNSSNNWLGVTMMSGKLSDTVYSKVSTPFDLIPVPMQTPAVAYDAVLKYAGCVLPNRDTLDQRIVNDVKNGTGRIIDVQGGYPHGTPYSETVNAWPALATTTPPVDSDHDGMPDAWETANGLNPNSAADRAGIAANGYTNLENYLNSLASDAMIISGGQFNSFSQTLGSPSAVQTYTFNGKNLTGDVTITPPAGYEISANGITWYNNNNPLILTATNGLINSNSISVRLNASTEGTYNNVITHTSTQGGIVQISVAGVANTVTAVSNVQMDTRYGIYPNPAHSSITIKHPRIATETVISIFTIDGKKLFSFEAAKGSEETFIDVKQLTAGKYLVELQNGTKVYSLNFIRL